MILLDKMRPAIGEEQYFANVRSVLEAFPVFSTYDARVDVIDLDADDDAPTHNFSTPLAVPVNVSMNNEEADDDDVSVEEPSYEHIRTHTLGPVLDLVALQGESDYTDDVWAAYLKKQKVQERRLREDDDADAAHKEH